jgi:uncharacterized protein YaiI (UPF0178 family)
MEIWVDADACPRVIKDILVRAAERTEVRATFVANKPLHLRSSPYLHFVRVPAGFDEADRRIVELMAAGDLVVTSDIPLAADVVKKGGLALDFRGKLYTEENVAEALATRNLMDQLRSEGHDLAVTPPLGKSERQAFANGLDRTLQKR